MGTAELRLVRVSEAKLSPYVLVVVLVFVISLLSWPEGGKDFAADIRPGARNWLMPWSEGMPQAPYVSLLLHPISYFRASVGTATVNAAGVAVMLLVLAKHKAPLWVVFPVLLSPVGYYELACGQTDWLPLAGVLVTGGADLILFTCKPQVAICGSVARLSRRSIVVALLFFVGTLLIWGLWPLKLYEFAWLSETEWNSAVWPLGIPAGAMLAILSYRRHDELLGVAASPLLFPYVNMGSYLGALMVLGIKYPKWLVVLWVTIWAVGLFMLL